MSHYNSIKTAWSESSVFKRFMTFMTPSKSRDRTHHALIDNMANEDSLLSVI